MESIASALFVNGQSTFDLPVPHVNFPMFTNKSQDKSVLWSICNVSHLYAYWKKAFISFENALKATLLVESLGSPSMIFGYGHIYANLRSISKIDISLKQSNKMTLLQETVWLIRRKKYSVHIHLNRRRIRKKKVIITCLAFSIDFQLFIHTHCIPSKCCYRPIVW